MLKMVSNVELLEAGAQARRVMGNQGRPDPYCKEFNVSGSLLSLNFMLRLECL
jgi:hypothetical protein